MRKQVLLVGMATAVVLLFSSVAASSAAMPAQTLGHDQSNCRAAPNTNATFTECGVYQRLDPLE
jgi:hypothetical protein